MIKMKYEEVLWRLKDHFAHHKDNVPHPYLDVAERLTYEAIEKQIPKKFEIWNGQDCCPNCKTLFGNDETIKRLLHWEMAYCKYCGQALDWSEYNESTV